MKLQFSERLALVVVVFSLLWYLRKGVIQACLLESYLPLPTMLPRMRLPACSLRSLATFTLVLCSIVRLFASWSSCSFSLIWIFRRLLKHLERLLVRSCRRSF